MTLPVVRVETVRSLFLAVPSELRPNLPHANSRFDLGGLRGAAQHLDVCPRVVAKDGTFRPVTVDGSVMDTTDTMATDTNRSPATKIAATNEATIHRARPASARRFAALCLAALAMGIGVATWFEVRGAVSYAGRLEARTTTVSAGLAGKVVSLNVVAGQRVVPGEKLFELADDRLASEIVSKKRELLELESELQRVQATADVELEWRRRDLQSEAFQTQLKAAAVTQERLSRQVEQLAWQEQLTGRPGDWNVRPLLVASTATFGSVILDGHGRDERHIHAMLKEDAAASASEALAAQLALCEQRLERLKKLDDELTGKVRLSVGVELAATRLKRVKDELSSLEQQCDSLTRTCPSHGVVGAVHREPGSLVAAGDAVVELFDDDRRHLVASIPSSAVAKLKPGTKLTLIFPARAKRIGLVATIPPQAMRIEGEQDEDSQVAVKIEPAGKLWPKVPIGSRVKVQVPQ